MAIIAFLLSYINKCALKRDVGLSGDQSDLASFLSRFAGLALIKVKAAWTPSLDLLFMFGVCWR